MSIQEQNKAIAQEFFDVMLTLKRSEKRLNDLIARGDEYRSQIDGAEMLGDVALINLELAADHVTDSLDLMANACAAAKEDGRVTVNPFEGPKAVLHDMRESIQREEKVVRAA